MGVPLGVWSGGVGAAVRRRGWEESCPGIPGLVGLFAAQYDHAVCPIDALLRDFGSSFVNRVLDRANHEVERAFGQFGLSVQSALRVDVIKIERAMDSLLCHARVSLVQLCLVVVV